MTGSRYPSIINGLPVVTAPAEIDGDTAEKFRAVLLRAAADGHATIVVDLTGTRFCDSGGLKLLDAAHQRALDEGGELRLVLPASGTVVRVLAITGLNRCIPCFTSLDQALAAPQPTHPHQRGRPAEWAKPVMYGMLRASVTAGESGPVIILAGEADLSIAEQLSALITGQMAGGTRQLTIDLSRLRFADSATIRTLALAARTLNERSGTLVLLHPQQSVTQVLALTGTDQILTIHRRPPNMPEPQTSQADDPASRLQVTVGTGAADPVIILAGEADEASRSQLAEVLDAQLSGQATHLTIEVSRLRSADSSFITALAAAAVVLRYRGGNMILMHPQQPVRRLLTAMRADHILTIRGETAGCGR
jgi:anti-anti-sigma factor